jgi:hypothetical protein
MVAQRLLNRGQETHVELLDSSQKKKIPPVERELILRISKFPMEA